MYNFRFIITVKMKKVLEEQTRDALTYDTDSNRRIPASETLFLTCVSFLCVSAARQHTFVTWIPIAQKPI
jgi:hypothetical protein